MEKLIELKHKAKNSLKYGFSFLILISLAAYFIMDFFIPEYSLIISISVALFFLVVIMLVFQDSDLKFKELYPKIVALKTLEKTCSSIRWCEDGLYDSDYLLNEINRIVCPNSPVKLKFTSFLQAKYKSQNVLVSNIIIKKRHEQEDAPGYYYLEDFKGLCFKIDLAKGFMPHILATDFQLSTAVLFKDNIFDNNFTGKQVRYFSKKSDGEICDISLLLKEKINYLRAIMPNEIIVFLDDNSFHFCVKDNFTVGTLSKNDIQSNVENFSNIFINIFELVNDLSKIAE